MRWYCVFPALSARTTSVTVACSRVRCGPGASHFHEKKKKKKSSKMETKINLHPNRSLFRARGDTASCDPQCPSLSETTPPPGCSILSAAIDPHLLTLVSLFYDVVRAAQRHRIRTQTGFHPTPPLVSIRTRRGQGVSAEDETITRNTLQ